ncbi:preprotein translocase subunit SecG [Sphingomonas sp.]|uniref:preprotein translocase subunit SecG n=1 Tax=Sphingomonas sp. TaxID=28214 RepID=UPI001B103269|nr:preprotein translocase subunit SecG [Sphingomonas sp.]MBO9712124.1 preprotein translocase subunit SecG [Sphingomonas sp.]
MLFTLLLVIQFLIALALVVVILVQRSEGGGLTSGGSPSGLMSARGAADFLTRATAILATAFILMSILLAVLAANRHSTAVDTTLQRTAPAPAAQPTPVDQVPFQSSGNATGPVVPAQQQAPAPQGNSAVPLGQ